MQRHGKRIACTRRCRDTPPPCRDARPPTGGPTIAAATVETPRRGVSTDGPAITAAMVETPRHRWVVPQSPPSRWRRPAPDGWPRNRRRDGRDALPPMRGPEIAVVMVETPRRGVSTGSIYGNGGRRRRKTPSSPTHTAYTRTPRTRLSASGGAAVCCGGGSPSSLLGNRRRRVDSRVGHAVAAVRARRDAPASRDAPPPTGGPAITAVTVETPHHHPRVVPQSPPPR
jgi:hypothetical protein